jgi:hypothetical protein
VARLRAAAPRGGLSVPQVAPAGHGSPSLLASIYLAVAVAVAVQRQHEADSDPDAGLIPITVPELLRLLRDIVVPPPRHDRAHRLHWPDWRRRHQHRARQAHQRWNAYAETAP